MASRPYESGSAVPGLHPVVMSRPQVSIERLPTRRPSNEPRESMNCKSCRKRKIKCNRLRPACEACQVFQCPCIYGKCDLLGVTLTHSSHQVLTRLADAVPKKRGPKTDVLEALLKRVDGLEAKLKEKKSEPDASASNPSGPADPDEPSAPVSRPPVPETARSDNSGDSALFSPTDPRWVVSPHLLSIDRKVLTVSFREPSPSNQQDDLLDTYFVRFHAKPFHILDESTLRQRLQLAQVPGYLVHAIYAVAAK